MQLTHASELLAPETVPKVPAGHAKQSLDVADPLLGLYVPAAHATQVEAPGLLAYVPDGHARQSLTVVALLELL